MSSAAAFTTPPGGLAGLLDRERTVARAGFNRWLVPPAALAVHLCIGKGGATPGALLAWAAVGIPIAYGVRITLSKSLILFGL